MTIRKCLSSTMITLALFSLSVSAQTPPEVLQFDPYLPGELNEQALMSLADEDMPAAQIYIERAYRLNPLSPDINSNLDVIRNLVESKAKYQVSQKEQAIKSLGMNQVDDSAESLPSLWPKR